MSKVELFQKNGRPTGIFYCSVCRVVFDDGEQADACHGKGAGCASCGVEINRKEHGRRFAKQCRDCEQRAFRDRQTAEELERFEKAAKIKAADWDGWVYMDNDQYFSDVDEAVESWLAGAAKGDSLSYVWAAKNVGIRKVRIEDAVGNVLENAWEDSELSDLKAVEELQEAIDAFNDANADIPCYYVDYSTAIVIDPPAIGAAEA